MWKVYQLKKLNYVLFSFKFFLVLTMIFIQLMFGAPGWLNCIAWRAAADNTVWLMPREVLCLFPIAALTDYHKLSGLKWYKFIILQLWRSEV